MSCHFLLSKVRHGVGSITRYTYITISITRQEMRWIEWLFSSDWTREIMQSWLTARLGREWTEKAIAKEWHQQIDWIQIEVYTWHAWFWIRVRKTIVEVQPQHEFYCNSKFQHSSILGNTNCSGFCQGKISMPVSKNHFPFLSFVIFSSTSSLPFLNPLGNEKRNDKTKFHYVIGLFELPLSLFFPQTFFHTYEVTWYSYSTHEHPLLNKW